MQKEDDNGVEATDMEDHCPRRPYRASANLISRGLQTLGLSQPVIEDGSMTDSTSVFPRSMVFQLIPQRFPAPLQRFDVTGWKFSSGDGLGWWLDS
jgi:hypothetical protein